MPTRVSTTERLRDHYTAELDHVAAALLADGEFDEMVTKAGLNDRQALALTIFAKGADLSAIGKDLGDASFSDAYRAVTASLNRIHRVLHPGLRPLRPARAFLPPNRR